MNQEKDPNVVRVAISIPSMGYTQVEAYCNRLVNFMHMGKLEAYGASVINLRESLKDESIEVVDRVMKAFLAKTPMYAFSKDGKCFEFYFSVIGKIFTPVARDEACRLALEVDADYILMIDDDMICPDDMFERLYAHNVDLVAALAFTRNAPHKPVLYTCIDGYDAIARKDYFINTSIMNYPKNKLVECDAVGFGAVLIKTWILKQMPRPWFMSTCGTGEDILFCYKAKKIGARVFSDTSTPIGHLGHPLNVTEEYVDNLHKNDELFNKKNSVPYNKYEAKVILGD